MPSKVHLVKAMVFLVVIYGCENWTLKKAELRRIDVFELWCWRRLLIVTWTERRSNQSILKVISPGCSLVGLILKLKLQYFAYLMQRANSLEKARSWERLRAGGELEGRGWDGWMVTKSMDLSLGELRSWWWTGRLGELHFMGSQRVRHDWETELNWIVCLQYIHCFRH